MTYRDIDLDSMEIWLSSEITKMDKRRAFAMPGPLFEWLTYIASIKPPRRQLKHMTLIEKTNPNRTLRTVAAHAGVDWVDNGLRKGFVSCHTRLMGAERTAAISGHSEEVLESDYKALVSHEEAKTWMGIFPPEGN